MKKVIAALAIIAASSAVSAQQIVPIEGQFVSENGKLFNVNAMRRIESADGYLKVHTFSNGYLPNTFADRNGDVYRKIIYSNYFVTKFFNVTGTNIWFNTDYVTSVSCTPDGKSNIVIEAEQYNYADNCQTFNNLRVTAQ